MPQHCLPTTLQRICFEYACIKSKCVFWRGRGYSENLIYESLLAKEYLWRSDTIETCIQNGSCRDSDKLHVRQSPIATFSRQEHLFVALIATVFRLLLLIYILQYFAAFLDYWNLLVLEGIPLAVSMGVTSSNRSLRADSSKRAKSWSKPSRNLPKFLATLTVLDVIKGSALCSDPHPHSLQGGQN